MVLEGGVEPPRSFGTPDFESGASASSATPAEDTRGGLHCSKLPGLEQRPAARIKIEAVKLGSTTEAQHHAPGFPQLRSDRRGTPVVSTHPSNVKVISPSHHSRGDQ